MPRWVWMLLLALPLTAPAAPEPGEEGIAPVLARGVPPPALAPPRGDEARGPFPVLLVTNAVLVDGTGAPPVGPVDIEIRNDRIVAIRPSGDASAAGAEMPGAGAEDFASLET